jgi:hypothetical protein
MELGMKVQESPAEVFTEVKSNTPMITVVTQTGYVNWPGVIVSTWSKSHLNDIGIFDAVPAEVPEGQMLTNVSFTRDEDGIIRQRGDLIPIP